MTAELPTGSFADIPNVLIKDILLKHYAPRVLLSDSGRPFLVQLLQDILSACPAVRMAASTYQPQTNGLTKRFNHTLADMISLYVSSERRNWDVGLPYFVFT